MALRTTSQTPHALFDTVLRLTAPNAGRMTGPGTNSYLVGDAQHGFVAVDPGPADAAHVRRLWQAAGGQIHLIVCTHSHPDHAPGAALLQALCARENSGGHENRNDDSVGAPPILGLPSAPHARPDSVFHPDRSVAHQERITWPGHALRVLHTPGHAANHICLVAPEHGLLFTGDHILQGTTTVIDPPDGNMQDYLDALDTLAAACAQHALRYILPAHGLVMTDPLGVIARLKAHRLQREHKVIAAMQTLPSAGPLQWLPLAYDDVERPLWPIALRSLQAHVERISTLQLHHPQPAQTHQGNTP